MIPLLLDVTLCTNLNLYTKTLKTLFLKQLYCTLNTPILKQISNPICLFQLFQFCPIKVHILQFQCHFVSLTWQFQCKLQCFSISPNLSLWLLVISASLEDMLSSEYTSFRRGPYSSPCWSSLPFTFIFLFSHILGCHLKFYYRFWNKHYKP